MRIAIIKLGALGDVIRTTVLLRPFHKKYPGCEIWWFTKSSSLPLLMRNPWITRVIAVDNLSRDEMNAIDFDLVLGLDDEEIACSLSSALRAKERFGAFLNEGTPRYTASSRAWFDMGLLNHDPDGSLTTANRLKAKNLKTYPALLFEMLNLLPVSPADSEPVLMADANEERWARSLAVRHRLQTEEQKIGLNTGAGVRWVNKQLSIPKTLALIDVLGRVPGRRLLLLGGPDELQRNQQILAQTPTPLIDTGTDNTLARFISIVNLCDVVVTSDSLALHIATALKKKVITFFGPTSAPEIEFYNRGVAWTARPPCECFYLPRCARDSFCLDRLDISIVEQQILLWQADVHAAYRSPIS